MNAQATIRMGVLGAARIVPAAVVAPSRVVPGVEIVAIAARDADRARRFAAKHGIPAVHDRYEDVLQDPHIDAVYIPLPNSLHCEWSLRALAAGKHVLCEKPIASNLAEAMRMAEAAEESGRVLMEAFHYSYHPLAERMRAIVASGELGRVRRIETRMCIPLLRPNDIRLRYDLAGGAVMDTGCYAIHMARHLAGAEPSVVSVEARLRTPEVDRYAAATLQFPDGRSGRVECSLQSRKLLDIQAIVTGDQGVMRVLNPVLPHLFHAILVRTERGIRWERVQGRTTYCYQLEEFARAVRQGVAPATGPDDFVANAKVIDRIYAAAGLRLRGT